MFCRNCAEVMLDTDITCPSCGFAAGTGVKYCAQCGSETPAGAVICEICGNPVNAMGMGGGQAFQQAPQAQPFAQHMQQAFQQQPDVQFRQAQPFNQAQTFGQQQAFGQQQTFGQQQGFGQPNFQQQYGQNSAQTFRSADPNMQGMNGAAGYSQPNTFRQNDAGQYFGTVTYKSKTLAGVLGIVLGCLGVHNFYLGYTSKGVVQLLMTLLSCGFLGAVSWIWGIVEGIMILSGSINQDGRGLPLKD